MSDPRPWLDADWPAPHGVHALTTLRYGAGGSAPPFDHFNLGMSCGDDADRVRANRRILRDRAELPGEPVWLTQVHGHEVVRIQRRRAREHILGSTDAAATADAAVTDAPGVVLAILSADCLPVLFCADDGSEIAAAHAGWRGLAAGVIEGCLTAMATPTPRLIAWLGPAAGPQAYEVGIEVRDALVALDATAANAFIPNRPGHFLCDLYLLARQRLARMGLNRVFGGERCTISDAARFFSHRRDQCTGRMASLVWVAPPHSPLP